MAKSSFHLPLIALFVNPFRAIWFMFLDFEKREAILKVAGLTSIYERFGDAGTSWISKAKLEAWMLEEYYEYEIDELRKHMNLITSWENV